MKTFKVTKAKTQTFKPTNIKSLTEFNGAIAAGVNGKVLTKLPVESIEVRPQVRTVIENIDELAESMKSGQLMPITVIKGENNKYVVLQGERRWLAAKKAGLETVEAIVVDAPVSDSERIFGQLTENIQR
ncbi:ParB N-terminal domain-containing protein, partial [Parasutterella sp.]